MNSSTSWINPFITYLNTYTVYVVKLTHIIAIGVRRLNINICQCMSQWVKKKNVALRFPAPKIVNSYNKRTCINFIMNISLFLFISSLSCSEMAIKK